MPSEQDAEKEVRSRRLRKLFRLTTMNRDYEGATESFKYQLLLFNSDNMKDIERLKENIGKNVHLIIHTPMRKYHVYGKMDDVYDEGVFVDGNNHPFEGTIEGIKYIGVEETVYEDENMPDEYVARF